MVNIQQTLASLSRQINQTGEQLDRQLTASQELTQHIDSGRQHYDDISKEAIPASAHAEAMGISLQLSNEQNVLEEQEYKVHVAFGLNRALSGQKPPPILHPEKPKLGKFSGGTS